MGDAGQQPASQKCHDKPHYYSPVRVLILFSVKSRISRDLAGCSPLVPSNLARFSDDQRIFLLLQAMLLGNFYTHHCKR